MTKIRTDQIAGVTADAAEINILDGATLTTTELNFVDGVGAPIQTQINALAAAGYVVGPASATDNAIARFDLTTGKVIQNSAATIADTSGNITAGTYNGNTIGAGSTSGTNTGDQTSVSGNSGTATALQNARTIGGVSFNGTANITVSTATAGFTVSGGDLAAGANNLTITGSIGATGARVTKGWFTDLQVTNAIAGSITGSAATVTNATLTTALTVNTGTVTLTGNAANTSVLTIGAGAVSVSGANTGDQTTVSGNAGTATALQNARLINGTSFNGTADITVTAAAGTLTGATLNSGVTASSLTSVGTLSSLTVGGTLAMGANNITSTGSLGATGARLLKGWFTDLQVTNAIAGSITGSAPTLTTTRSIYGNNFDGSAALAQIIASTFGGTGNGFTKFSGPATAEKTFTLPNASATVLTDNAAVTVAQGGTGRATGTTAYSLVATGTTATGAQQTLANGATTEILVGGGASALPVWTTAQGSGAPVRAVSPTLSGTPVLGAANATSINFGVTALSYFADAVAFTPGIAGTTIAGTPTVSAGAIGSYTRINNRIDFNLRMITTAITGMTGGVKITGLPFSSNGSYFYPVTTGPYNNCAASIINNPTGYVTNGGTDIILQKGGAGSSTALLVTDITATFDIWIYGSYFI